MHSFRSGRDPEQALSDDIGRLSALLEDMASIARGELPESISGPSAPLLDSWALARVAVPCLIGLATGHPKLPSERRPIATSDIWLVSKDQSWARSLSRWYRLGRPAGQSGPLS